MRQIEEEEEVRIAIVSYVSSSWHLSRMKREVLHRKVRGRLCDNTVRHIYPLVHHVHSLFLKNSHGGPPWPKMPEPFFVPVQPWGKLTLRSQRLEGYEYSYLEQLQLSLLFFLSISLPWGRTTLQFQAPSQVCSRFKTILRVQPRRQWLQNGMARWCPIPHSLQTHPTATITRVKFKSWDLIKMAK